MAVDIRKYLTVCNGMKERTGRGPKEFVVTDVREKKNGFINPVLVSFQNGDVNDRQLSGFKVSLMANKNGETNVEVETSYGHVFKDPNCSAIVRPKQVIAIRNKKTSKVRIVEVDSAILINSTLLHSPVTDKSEKDYIKDMKILNKTFGSKKTVTRLEQKDKLNVSSIPVADVVKKAVEDIKIEGSNVSLNETETGSMLDIVPPCHREATKVTDVYQLSEILSVDQIQELTKEVDRMDENKFNPEESRPMKMRDKCLCYIIAVALICCNYNINLKILSTSTAVHLTRLTRLARVVGAVPASKDDSNFVLKLPLPSLPKSSAKKPQRK